MLMTKKNGKIEGLRACTNRRNSNSRDRVTNTLSTMMAAFLLVLDTWEVASSESGE